MENCLSGQAFGFVRRSACPSARLASTPAVMFMEAAKYDLKTNVSVGLVISREGEFYQLDWCLVDGAWEADPRIQHLLSEGLFRPARETSVDSFLFRGDVSGSVIARATVQYREARIDRWHSLPSVSDVRFDDFGVFPIRRAILVLQRYDADIRTQSA